MEVIDVEYIHSALILNALGKEVKEKDVKKILEAAGGKPEDVRIKALISALDGVDIKEAISKSAVAMAAPVPAAGAVPVATEEAAPKEEESEEEKEKKSEEAASGLANLFG